jgi:hypothetical protein
MKKSGIFFVIAVIFAAIFIAGCAGSQAPADLPPIPEGAERVRLENGAYAIYRFDLPAGTKWSDYSKITADYMVDEENIKKKQRNDNNVRLMGNYREDQFEDSGGVRNFNLGDGPGSANGPYIMDNTPRTFANMGAVPNEWFTVTYDLSGSRAHSQFNRAHIPAADATGPFFFGIGIPSMFEGRRNGMTQFIRNVTLHHTSDPELNVVSTGSGFDEPTFVSFFPIMSAREK